MSELEQKKRMIRSFIKYSRLGLASKGLDSFDAYDRIRGCSSDRREAKELLAVYDTVRFLRLTENTEALGALCFVYFSISGAQIKKRQISERVLRYAYENHCDQRTVYRRLAYAAKVYRMMLG